MAAFAAFLIQPVNEPTLFGEAPDRTAHALPCIHAQPLWTLRRNSLPFILAAEYRTLMSETQITWRGNAPIEITRPLAGRVGNPHDGRKVDRPAERAL